MLFTLYNLSGLVSYPEKSLKGNARHVIHAWKHAYGYISSLEGWVITNSCHIKGLYYNCVQLYINI
jgi:hypothetical protein